MLDYMGRMTLDDRIKTLERVIENTHHMLGADEGMIQLVEWLKELKKYKEKDVNCTDLCKSCNTKGCIFQSGIARSHCDFYKAESDKECEK
jgi:hypothetical protein